MPSASVPYLRSRKRRGRWAHYYRRDGREINLGVHGVSVNDPRVLAAWATEHARWEDAPKPGAAPKAGSFEWAVEMYMASPHWSELAAGTQQSRHAIYRRYVAAHGRTSVSNIRMDDLEAGLVATGGHAAVNELKALKPVFAFLRELRYIASDPAAGIKLRKPKSDGHPTATAEEIAAFQTVWPRGTRERLVFDLALYTGAARVDLVRLGQNNIENDLLAFRRKKTGVLAQIPITSELQQVLDDLPDISPAFILTSRNRPFSPASLGNFFADAAKSAGIKSRLHGLRKAFCVYWAEQGASTHQIAAMAGHLTLAEVERYTRAADRTKMVRLLVKEN